MNNKKILVLSLFFFSCVNEEELDYTYSVVEVTVQKGEDRVGIKDPSEPLTQEEALELISRDFSEGKGTKTTETSGADKVSSYINEFADSLDEDTLDAILKDEKDFFELLDASLKNEDYLRFVDKKHSLDHYQPSDLVELDNYNELTLNKNGMLLRKVAISPLLEMVADAEEDGIMLDISSAYRTYEYQEALFNRYVEQDGLEEAQRYSARAGYSEHQLGMAIDFGSVDQSYKDDPAGKWLKANSWKYGFVMSFPEGEEKLTGYMFEPWHFRYVGKETAEIVHNYFGDVSYNYLEFVDQNKKRLKEILVMV